MDLDRTGDFNFSETCTLAQTELSSQDAVALPPGASPRWSIKLRIGGNHESTDERVPSVLLVVCLLCSALPSAFAAERAAGSRTSQRTTGQDAITEAVAAGYFKGVSDTAFDPEGTLTRAMLVTVLARAAGAETDDNASTGFSDVAAGTWYTGAVAWAAENGVVTGDGDGTLHRTALPPVRRRQPSSCGC